MMTTQIINHIKAKDFPSFEKEWRVLKHNLSEVDKQNLLIEILSYHYTEKVFEFYIKVFNKIIDSKVSLDFNIEHWAPTFLSLVAYQSSRQLFDYFVGKGASLNFIGDIYAFESEETIKNEVGDNLNLRYWTCLDFVGIVLADALTVDYNFHVPEVTEYDTHWSDCNDKDEITIRKKDYYYLIHQSQYLHNLIHTDRLIDHIKSLGGKTYQQL